MNIKEMQMCDEGTEIPLIKATLAHVFEKRKFTSRKEQVFEGHKVSINDGYMMTYVDVWGPVKKALIGHEVLIKDGIVKKFKSKEKEIKGLRAFKLVYAGDKDAEQVLKGLSAEREIDLRVKAVEFAGQFFARAGRKSLYATWDIFMVSELYYDYFITGHWKDKGVTNNPQQIKDGMKSATAISIATLIVEHGFAYKDMMDHIVGYGKEHIGELTEIEGQRILRALIKKRQLQEEKKKNEFRPGATGSR